ncbi:hypothetical protein BC830DRAFT_1076347 [Chytriomyces sp. MP71]|nr:hypothetical protein BC830DRAFT_1076347 [Chytriomyces sp. MP71]
MPFVPYVFTVVLLAVSVNTAPAQAAKRVKTTTNKQGKALNAAVTTAAISPAGVTYQGGALLNKVRVVPLYWGTQVTYNYDAFYCQAVSSTSFMDVFSQYGSGLASGTCSPGLVNENGANNGTVNVSAVEAYIISLIKNTTLNATGGSLWARAAKRIAPTMTK